MTYKVSYVLAVLALSVFGCAPAGVQLAPELGVDPGAMERGPGGLLFDDVTVGDGRPAVAGDTVVMHYTGWLADGTRFEASRDHGQPLVAELGRRGPLVRGWSDGVEGMRAGGRRILVIPPVLAYGSRGVEGVIPPHATLVFEVDLLEIR